MRNFLSIDDVSDPGMLVNNALAYKKAPFRDRQLGVGKTLGMLFLNPSLRTRVSTQVAARNLGMEVIIFNIDKEGWQLAFTDGVVMDGKSTEHVKEAAVVLGQ